LVVRQLPDDIAEPLFILSAPRSFSSVVCAMLGQHPRLHGLPETHLFSDETVERWWTRSSAVSFDLSHGLLRAVAEIVYGGQSETTVRKAAGWLRRRTTCSSGMVFEELARAVFPLTLIDKSPSIVYHVDSMQRAFRFFPEARFLHLVRHPRTYGQSVIKYMHLLAQPEYQPAGRSAALAEAPVWIKTLASFSYSSPINTDYETRRSPIDPQASWYLLNRNVITFLADVPAEQSMVVRGEVLLTDPATTLAEIVQWLGIEMDDFCLEQMMYPERSPYAFFGPPGARLGNDILFLEDPRLRRDNMLTGSLDDPMTWGAEGETFLPEVRDLARQLGYS
jgi:hypothetical protein